MTYDNKLVITLSPHERERVLGNCFAPVKEQRKSTVVVICLIKNRFPQWHTTSEYSVMQVTDLLCVFVLVSKVWFGCDS